MREGEALGAAIALAEHAATQSPSEPNTVMIPHARLSQGAVCVTSYRSWIVSHMKA